MCYPREFKVESLQEYIQLVSEYASEHKFAYPDSSMQISKIQQEVLNKLEDELHRVGCSFVKEPNIIDYDFAIKNINKLRHDIEKERIYNDVIKKISLGKDLSGKVSDPVEKLYHEIKSELPDFERRINPIDLLTPYFVRPLGDNARINRQAGAFIICGTIRR